MYLLPHQIFPKDYKKYNNPGRLHTGGVGGSSSGKLRAESVEPRGLSVPRREYDTRAYNSQPILKLEAQLPFRDNISEPRLWSST